MGYSQLLQLTIPYHLKSFWPSGPYPEPFSLTFDSIWEAYHVLVTIFPCCLTWLRNRVSSTSLVSFPPSTDSPTPPYFWCHFIWIWDPWLDSIAFPIQFEALIVIVSQLIFAAHWSWLWYSYPTISKKLTLICFYDRRHSLIVQMHTWPWAW